jgi:aminopeptidase N
MIKESIGDHMFRLGLQYYLAKFAYKNAERLDFLQAFSR